MAQQKVDGSQVDSTTLDLSSSDGSVLTGIDAANIATGVLVDARVAQTNVTQHQAALSISGGQVTSAVANAVNATTLGGQSVGTGPNDIVALDASSRLPAVNGSLLTNLPVPPFRGALVKPSVNVTIPDNTFTIFGFDVEVYDTDNIHDNITNNSRLTVPAGVSRVKVVAQVNWSTSSTGTQRSVDILKNGTGGYDGYPTHDPGSAAAADRAIVRSPVLNVVPGDYFEVRGVQNSGSTLSAFSSITWFAMEIIE